jgi:hypothetical protein
MEVIISDESINMYGFRVLTAGIDLTAFEKNPVMLYDHARRKDYEQSTKDIILPIGKWNKLRKEGGKLIGEPEFDIEDSFAKEVARKFEKGYLNAASLNFGFDRIEWSEDPALMLPGQTGPTIVKCMLREISITDIPGNYNSVKLSAQDKEISLNGKSTPEEIQAFFSQSITTKTESTMKKVIAALNASKLCTLNDSASEDLVASGVETLTGQLSAKDQIIAQKDAEIKRLNDAAQEREAKALSDKAVALVEGALSARKIVATQKDNLVKLASASEEGYTNTKQFIDSLKPFESVNSQLRATGGDGGAPVKTSLSAEFEKHANEGTLEQLKAENFEHFKEVYKAGTGKDYKG